MDILEPGNKIKMELITDSPGRGAAIVAAMSCHLNAAGEYK